MAKVRKCSKCDDPAVDGRRECAEHYAEYMREYRARDAKQRDSEQIEKGFRDGVARAVAFLRGRVGGSPVTGFAAAVMIERACLLPESPGVADRQKLIASMRPVL
jgi:hypothetical protein